MKQVRKIGALLMAVAVMAVSTMVPSFAADGDTQDVGYSTAEISVSKAEAVAIDGSDVGEENSQTYSFEMDEDGKIVVFDQDGNEIKINFEQAGGELTLDGGQTDAQGYTISIVND